MRASEWVLLGFFVYIALVSIALHPSSAPRLVPWLVLLGAATLITALAAGDARIRGPFLSHARDWTPLLLTLCAYREMDWFTPARRDFHLENAWVIWDRMLLDGWGGRRLIESAGALLPEYLEFCYLLVYAVGPFTLAVLYVCRRRELVDSVLVLYLLGTLGAYALFPYFPSAPPRTAFAGADLPGVSTRLRECNLWLLRGYAIHSSVFPSAHVSSAFSAAWALSRFLPDHQWIGRGMLAYAASVAVATVYGRYHYAVDAVAGLAISLAVAILVRALRLRGPL